MFLPQLQSRLRVQTQWLWTYFTGQRGSRMSLTFTAHVAAIAPVGAAAWFSIRGMVVLFPGAPMSVVGMAIAMEGPSS